MTIDSARSVIAELRGQGRTWAAVARQLNATGVPTPTGRGRWWGEAVARYANPEDWAAYMRDYRRRTTPRRLTWRR